MYYPDTDPGMELEAIENERFDADLEMAQLHARASAAERDRQAGVCQHSSRIGKSRPDQLVYPVQALLRVGEEVCTEGTGGCRLIADNEYDDPHGFGWGTEWNPDRARAWAPAAWGSDEDAVDRWLTRVSEAGAAGALAESQLAG